MPSPHADFDNWDFSSENAHLPLGGWRAPSPFTLSFAANASTSTLVKESEHLTLVSPKRLGVGRFSLEAQERFSYMSSSAGSDPGMMEDSLGWSDSDMSYDEDEGYTSSPRSPAASPKKLVHATPMYQVMTTFTPTHKTTGLRRSEARRAAPFPLQNFASAPVSQYSRPPVRTAPQPPVQQWTHAKTHPTGMRSRSLGQPSTLATCTTARPSPRSSGASTPTAAYSAPVSATFPSEPLMELMEKSVFEDDDDDDEEERSAFVAFASRLRIRGSSITRKDKKESKRSASDTMRGVFGMKK
ncbi:hypothetical protein PVAG01_08739 [Phlyctema vagabunda]|uniref:Uncharacterized protein n=1 Tax=Phlyctema vagabunda TaxID=108571 RepID=A0ABR4PAC7_9HELO